MVLGTDLAAGDSAVLLGLIALAMAVVRLIEWQAKRLWDRRANGNGYHKHRRPEDTKEIAAEARAAGVTDAKVTALGTDMDRLSVESADTTARLVRVETRLDEIKADVGEIKGSISTLHRRIDGQRGGKG